MILRSILNESSGKYRISGDRLIVDWQAAKGISLKIPKNLSRQRFELVWIDNENLEIEAMSKGWLTGADDWEDTVVFLTQQSTSLYGEHRVLIEMR